MLPKLYAITDRTLVKTTLEDEVRLALEAGVRLIQLREKNISVDEYTRKALKMRELTNEYGALLIINDSVEVCRNSGADGVHLGQSDGDVKAARNLLGTNAVIGVTAKTVGQALKAAEDGADYIGSGAVFGTSTKKDAAKMDMARLREITEISRIPVYAIGGINSENIALLRSRGVYGAAVVSGIFDGDIEKNVSCLAKEVQKL